MLENVNLDRTLSKDDYRKALPALQHRLYDLEKACWDSGIPSILIFEGWEASGKGGSISALTQRLDPRGFKLSMTTEPRTHEMNYPWLRRFWLKIPNRGEIVIFDHSWYYHVLEERVEKAVDAREWRKAYTDIVEFERMLAADGCVFIKFWFHISQEEQKRRFKAIEKDPLEAWRITARDWKRHDQYPEYMEAAEQMLEMTESDFAPWTIVEATSKYHARVRVFETAIAALEHALGDKAPPLREEDRAARVAAAKKSAAKVEGRPAKSKKPTKPEKPTKPKKKDKPLKSKAGKAKTVKSGAAKPKAAKPKAAKPKAKVGKPGAAKTKAAKRKGGKSNA